MEHYCTYFDRRYLARGLALYRSLERHAGPFRLHALCLDEATERALARLDLPGVERLALAAFEQGDERLLAAKKSRSLVEYYFTCTASLVLYLLRRCPEAGRVTYLDADLFFFGSPAPLFEEMGAASIALVEGRYPPQWRKKLERFGKYNVGLLVFRNDERARACLEWWRERCLEWCYDRLEDGKFADQKYLDEWPERFGGVTVLRHPGVNVAPWNVAGSRITTSGGRVLVNGAPLVCYHFHNLRKVWGPLFDSGLAEYGVAPVGAVRRGIYAPYLRELRRGERDSFRVGAARRKRGVVETIRRGGALLAVGPLVLPIGLGRAGGGAC